MKIINTYLKSVDSASLEELRKNCNFSGVENILKILLSKGEIFKISENTYKKVIV